MSTASVGKCPVRRVGPCLATAVDAIEADGKLVNPRPASCMICGYPRPAVVCVQSWGGRGDIPVTVLGETPRRYRCRFERTALQWTKGTVHLVPKYAVKFTEPKETP